MQCGGANQIRQCHVGSIAHNADLAVGTHLRADISQHIRNRIPLGVIVDQCKERRVRNRHLNGVSGYAGHLIQIGEIRRCQTQGASRKAEPGFDCGVGIGNGNR